MSSLYLTELGLSKGMHVLVHCSYRTIRKVMDVRSISELITTIQQIVTNKGSVIMPAFSYCYRRMDNTHDVFDKHNTESKVGAVSEVFRRSAKVKRTASPTHSFSIWGRAAMEIPETNAPTSPLGKGSVCDWMTKTENTYVLLLGVNFTSLSYAHYLENITLVPWHDLSPWDYMYVEKIGVSTVGEQVLTQLPGCSKSFVNFQKYLEEKNQIVPFRVNGVDSFLIPVSVLFKEGCIFFQNHPDKLLCKPGSCPTCDERYQKMKDK